MIKFLAAFLLLVPSVVSAQAPTGLTENQSRQFADAGRLFDGGKFAEAQAELRSLAGELQPGTAEYTVVERRAADAAINAGDYDFALKTLKPMEAADTEDWQAAGMLARVYAETGKAAARDREITRILELHKHAASPQIARLQQFYLERITVPGGTIRVSVFLEPYGRFRTELYAWVCDPVGQRLLRVALENSDIDQAFFAKEHPEQVKQGMRRYSLDGYDQKTQPDGSVTTAHMTYGFYDGRPAYDVLRARIIEVGTARLKQAK